LEPAVTEARGATIAASRKAGQSFTVPLVTSLRDGTVLAHAVEIRAA
jgi:hypothetical protein